MNKNTVKKLAENPHYTMNDKELDALAQLLREEAEVQKDDEKKETHSKRYINKNRVNKTVPKLDKNPDVEEGDYDVDSE